MLGVDLFAGAGGLSAGARAAGVRIAVAVESDPRAADAYRLNHPEADLRVMDVRRLPDPAPIATSQPTVLLGGPPCQAFSSSNQRSRSLGNPANRLYVEMLRVARAMRPTHVVIENVRGFVEAQGGLFLSDALKRLRELGYHVAHGMLDAADFGVPQHRRRLFIVGSRGRPPRLPRPVGGPRTTVADALLDLPVLENGAALPLARYRRAPHSAYARRLRGDGAACTGHLVTRNAPHIVERYRHVPPGGNWRAIPARLMAGYADRTRCHEGLYRRLRWDAPSVVLNNFRKNMLIHPWAQRGLSVREAARLQSFPDAHAFAGSIGFQQQQVADAVPPLMARAVLESVLQGAG